MKRLLLATLLLSACQTIGDAADDLGSHMPVIGERCEHWQCITESGRAQSNANKAARKPINTNVPAAQQQQPPAPQPVPESSEKDL